MSAVSIVSCLEINEEELGEFVRAEIDGSDFGCLIGDAVSEALSDWDLDDMQSEVQQLDDKFDRCDDRLDDVERSINLLMEKTEQNNEDWKAVRGGLEPDEERLREIIGQEIDGFDLSGFKTSPEVDRALQRQHQRISELEHAMLCIFEHLHSARQQNLGRGHERFHSSLQGDNQ
jgi:predicted  nucleic acid-binding Zn-ribbon protein